jgi:zinc transporter ZupT
MNKKYIFPIIGIIIGILIGLFVKYTSQDLAVIQMIAASIVIAALSTEVMPKLTNLKDSSSKYFLIIGLALGLVSVITLRSVFTSKQNDNERMNISSIIGICIILFATSILLGITACGPGGCNNIKNLFLVAALSFELFILAMTTSSQLKNTESSTLYLIMAVGLMMLAIVGGFMSGYVISNKFNGKASYYFVLAFAISSLVWLLTEDVMSKSKDVDPRIAATVLIVGFVASAFTDVMFHNHK